MPSRSVEIFIKPAKGVVIFIQPVSLSCDHCGLMQKHARNSYRHRPNISYHNRRSIAYIHIIYTVDICYSMLYNERVVLSALWGSVFSVFFSFNPNTLSEMNQIWIVSSICINGATLKILVLRVLWFSRKLAHRQTDTANT